MSDTSIRQVLGPGAAFALVVLGMTFFAPPSRTLSAQASESARTGTIVVAHGGSREWNDYVRAAAQSARTGGPVKVSFLMGPEEPANRFVDVAAKLEREGVSRIVVVPMLVSSFSEHYQQIRYLAGATDSLDHKLHALMGHDALVQAALKVPVTVTPALDDSPVMAEILAERARALATAPNEQALFLVGHGPNSAEDYARWMEKLRPVADSVKARTGFRDVRVDLVRDDAPKHVRREAVRRVRELIELQHRVTGRDVVVVPVLLSRGRVSRETFLADLAGLPVVYQGDPLLPHPALSRWIEQRVRESGAPQPVRAGEEQR